LQISVTAEPAGILTEAALLSILPTLALLSALFSTTDTLPLKLYNRKLALWADNRPAKQQRRTTK